MKRKPHRKRRLSGRRRVLARPQLEILEARLVLSVTPVAPVKQPVVLSVTTFTPPSGQTPTNPGANNQVNTPAPPGDEVFLSSLLHLGGGHPQELLHFPASGGGNEEKASGGNSSRAGTSQELESEVFACEFWSDSSPIAPNEETAAVLTQLTESLVE
jgi:hypothetical protein